MSIDLIFILLIGIGYLLLVSAIAYGASAGWIPQSITNHPITYVFSLGIFFSAWSFYGVLDLANEFGYGALAYYMGTGMFFLFSPIIQAPLAELCQRFQLRSIADLLVFRYNSQLAGRLATLFIAFSIIPILILQIQAVSETVLLVTTDFTDPLVDTITYRETRHEQSQQIGLGYCILMAIFCIIFGAGYSQYKALITTMAFESLVKVTALVCVGGFAIFGVFGGFAELDWWLVEHPMLFEQLYATEQSSSAHILLLVFIATGVLMPHVFHMSHMDQSINQVARMLTWAFPLFMLLMALPIFPILWAGLELDVPYDITYFTLGVPQMAGPAWLTVLAWLGGISAASGVLVVSTLSLATMMLNQWVLPLYGLRSQIDIYAKLIWLRRIIIVAIIVVSYSLYLWLNSNYSLMDLALLSFIQALQFVPSVIAISYWPRGNRFGFHAGLSAGTCVWLFGLAIPVLIGENTFSIPFFSAPITLGIERWESITLFAIAVNTIIFALVSLLTPMSDEELYQAEVCAEDELSQPIRRILDVPNAREFIQRLSTVVGDKAARQEVDKALDFLGLNENESRPYALRRIRARIRINLAGLMGQSVANDIIDRLFPFRTSKEKDAFDINLMENRLERMGTKFHGLSADINQLRLHHRKTLQELPIAICSIGSDDEILLWNHAMANLTDISSQSITGSNIINIPEPWGQMICDFANDDSTQANRQSIDHEGNTQWYRLLKSELNQANVKRSEGQVILVENITDVQLMEQELIHKTRLASIGQLAAGVAHEIGNPVTGIACLAQNLEYEEDRDEQVETARAILSQTERINRIVQSLVSYGHAGKSNQKDHQTLDIHGAIEESIHLLSLQKDRKPIEYSNQVENETWVLGDNQRLIQVFVNLLSNANDASPEFSTITFESRRNPPFIEIDITDEGSGIPKELQEQVMDPFFTTKETGKGTGLGLSIVFNIIDEHQGHVSVTSPVAHGKGTRFTIKLPMGYDEELNSTEE